MKVENIRNKVRIEGVSTRVRDDAAWYKITIGNSIKVASILILAVAIFSFIETEHPQNAYAVTYTFTTPLNLDTGNTGSNQQILVNGSNIFVVWKEGATGHIYYERSVDGGSTFNGGTPLGTPVDLSSLISGSASSPQIAFSGGHVYVVWQQGSSTHIYITNSTDSGATFNGGTSSVPGTPTLLSNSGSTSINPQISAVGSNAYVVWADSTTPKNIFYEKSTDGGLTFNANTGGTTHTAGTPIAISDTASTSSTPQIFAIGTNVFSTWAESGGIFFTNSTDSGATFNGGTSSSPGAPVNLSSIVGTQPKLVASNTNVVVTWRQVSNNHVFTSNSTDGGKTFNGGTTHTPGSSVDLGPTVGVTGLPANLQIAMSGSHVYISWSSKVTSSNTNSIFFTNSTDSGKTFNGGTHTSGTPTVISSTDDAILPTMAASGSNVYLAWKDTVADSGNGDIYFSSSNNNGSSFNGANSHTPGTPQVIPPVSAGVASTNPVIGASGITTYAIWQEGASGFPLHFVRGTPSTTSVGFDSIQYTQSGVAIITASDPVRNTNNNLVETTTANIKSTSDSVGITVTLTETGKDTGVFTGQITFTSGTSSANKLQANPGNTITATYTDTTSTVRTGTASIYAATVTFDFSTYTMNSFPKITVNDQNAIKTPSSIETVSITTTSTTTPSGVSLTLTETGPGTGVFKNNKVVLTTGNAQFQSTNTATLSQSETSGGTTTDNTITTLNVQVTSTTDSTGLSISLTETGPNTGVFTGQLLFTTTGSSTGNTLRVSNGDIIGTTYLGETANGLIIPNSDVGVNTLASAIGDTLTAKYVTSGGTVSGTATISAGTGGGGGGGGIVRPGLVLNVIASLSKGGSSVSPSFSLDSLAITQGSMPENIRQQVLNQDPTKPLLAQHDQFDYPVIIDGGGYVIGRYENKISTVTENTNTPVDLKLNIPATNLQHIAMYVNLHGKEDDLGKSDTYIIYDKGAPLTIVDPHHYFDHVKFDLTTEGVKNKIDYTITFANPMEKSNMVLRTWNDRHASSDVVLLDVLQVVDSKKLTSSDELSPLQQQQIPIPQTAESQPESKVPSWIKNNVKLWNAGSIKDKEFETGIQYLISEKIISIPKQTVEPTESSTIPKWVKNTAGFWANGDVSEDEFLHGIEYLVKMGIITP